MSLGKLGLGSEHLEAILLKIIWYKVYSAALSNNYIRTELGKEVKINSEFQRKDFWKIEEAWKNSEDVERYR